MESLKGKCQEIRPSTADFCSGGIDHGDSAAPELINYKIDPAEVASESPDTHSEFEDTNGG